MEEKMNELISILSGIRQDIDFESEKNLIDDAWLDSVDILTIVTAISEHYNINIPITYIVPENFNSAENMLEMIHNIKK